MSTNKTTHYHLHSWEKDDKFLMDEVNDNFTKLDESLDAEVTRIDAVLQDLTHKRIRAVAGSYQGTGAPHHVDLGGHPLAVHFENKKGTRYSNTNFVGGGLVVRDMPLYEDVTIDETGFSFLDGASNGVNSKETFMFLAILEDK